MFILPPLVAVVLVITRTSVAHAQLTNAVCTDQFAWMSNSRGQNPCLVTAYLDVPCLGVNSSVEALDHAGKYYPGPSGNHTNCACNTVVYSLIEACQWCQFNTGSVILTWTGYAQNCANTTNRSYPQAIPAGTAIPAWAFLDVTTNDGFNVTAALAVANEHSPDTTASPPASVASTSSSTAFLSQSRSTTTSASPKASSPATGSPTAPIESVDSVSSSGTSCPTGPIVGGILGGVAGLLLAGTLAHYLFLFIFRQRKRARATGDDVAAAEAATGPSIESTAKAPVGPYGPQLGTLDGAVALSPAASMVYDPDDPRTFPPEPFAIARMGSVSGSASGHMRDAGAPPGYSSSLGFYSNLASSTYKGSPEVIVE